MEDREHSTPSFKIVILDEADSMTKDAQTCLRRIMELYSQTTRFCLICNYVSKIIDPIASRCAKFRFNVLSGPVIRNRLSEIAAMEHFSISDEALMALVELSDGDLRKAINLLQSIAPSSVSSSSLSRPVVSNLTSIESMTNLPLASIPGQTDSTNLPTVTKKDLEQLSCYIPDSLITGLVYAIQSGVFDKVKNLCDELIHLAYPVDQILLKLQQKIISDTTKIPEPCKAKILIRIAETDKKLIDGADEGLQLLAFSSFCSLTIQDQNMKQSM